MGSISELLSTEAADTSDFNKTGGFSPNHVEEIAYNPEDDSSDQVPTLAIREKSLLHASSTTQLANTGEAPSNPTDLQKSPHLGDVEDVVMNGELESPGSRRKNIIARTFEGKGSFVNVDHISSSAGPKIPDYSPRKFLEMKDGSVGRVFAGVRD
ncbi:unnamed protein product [Ilex paraguariensis]|uniref:Uncharacterized protein n=1 Tax=Ilex paraguariensis TaxID=185542 RepID=A0ABC8R6X6_9AQUA